MLLNLRVGVEHAHVDVAERRAVVREGAVAQRRTGNRGEPAIEDGELGRQRGQHRQFVGREVVHDLARVLDVPAHREVALHETLHRRHPRRRRVAVEDLQIHRRRTRGRGRDRAVPGTAPAAGPARGRRSYPDWTACRRDRRSAGRSLRAHRACDRRSDSPSSTRRRASACRYLQAASVRQYRTRVSSRGPVKNTGAMAYRI